MTAFLSRIACAGLLVGAFASSALAAPHTYDTVTSTSGTWQVSMAPLYEGASFVNEQNQTITAFPLTAQQPMKYGFVLPASADFNIAYAITAVQQTSHDKKIGIEPGTKACVFIVTATSPKNPNVKVVSYNSAVCNWGVVPGKGENYYVG